MRPELENDNMVKQYIELKDQVEKAFRLKRVELFVSVLVSITAMILSYKLIAVIKERDNALEITKQYYERYMKVSRDCQKCQNTCLRSHDSVGPDSKLIQ